jgi:hypothetical protein
VGNIAPSIQGEFKLLKPFQGDIRVREPRRVLDSSEQNQFNFDNQGIRERIDSAINKLCGVSQGGLLTKNLLEDTGKINSMGFTKAEKALFSDILKHFDEMDALAFGGKPDQKVGIYDIFQYKKGDKYYQPGQVVDKPVARKPGE